MLAANYPTKKDLKAAVGQDLRYEETSFFGTEYRADGVFNVVGPSATKRNWYATVTMVGDKISKVG